MIREYLKKTIVFDFYNYYKLHRFKNEWRKNNPDNMTTDSKAIAPNTKTTYLKAE